MDLAQINLLVEANNRFLPTVKIETLTQNLVYVVTRIARVTTRFGQAVVLDLNFEFTIFLPTNTGKLFIAPHGDALFSTLENLFNINKLGMKYLGGINKLIEWVNLDDVNLPNL